MVRRYCAPAVGFNHCMPTTHIQNARECVMCHVTTHTQQYCATHLAVEVVAYWAGALIDRLHGQMPAPSSSSKSSPFATIAPSKVAISMMHVLGAILPRCKRVPAAMPNMDLTPAHNETVLLASVSKFTVKSLCCCRRTQARTSVKSSPVLNSSGYLVLQAWGCTDVTLLESDVFHVSQA